MGLVDVYIHEVTRRLPEKMREDIALELRSTIEDMLPEQYSEDEVKKVLNELGSPAMLASGYSDQPMHLIGPRYFDAYWTLLKMMLPIAAIIAVIVMISEIFTNESAQASSIFTMFFEEGITTFVSVVMQAAFWITLFFAVFERTDKSKGNQPLTPSFKEWTADELKHVTPPITKKAVSKVAVFISLLWTAIWGTIYFNANKIVGIYENTGDGLQFVIPALNQDVLQMFWPAVSLILLLEVIFALYKLIVGAWTKRLAIFNVILQVFATIVFIIMIVNKDIINVDFVEYMADIFTMSASKFNASFISGLILVFVISAISSIYDGFKKSK